jgi:hypothetical protein
MVAKMQHPAGNFRGPQPSFRNDFAGQISYKIGDAHS